MNNRRKKPSADLRKYHTIFLQLGLIAVMLIFIVAMKVEFISEQPDVDLTNEQEVTKMEDIIQTKQEEKPPPPPPPQVPVEVPNDEIIEEQNLNINAEINLDEPLEMPPPPEEEEEEEDFFMAVGEMPELKGGQEWLYNNLEYPDLARKAGIEGRVYLQFRVDENGNIKNLKVLRGIGGGCDEAAMEVMKKAEFTPGRQRGRPVEVQMSQVIFFQLQN